MTYRPPEEFDAWRKERGLAMNDEERACKGKRVFYQRKHAKRAIKNAPKGRFKIYRCPFCGDLHLATKKAPAPGRNEGQTPPG